MKRGAPDHWKMKDLAARLGVPKRYALPWANGVMERLWHFTAKYAPQGDIGRAPDTEIAEVCCWPTSETQRLLRALLDSGWLEPHRVSRLLVHNWPEHADDSVKKTLKNRGLEFIFPENSSQPDGKFPTATPCLATPEPLPEPHTTKTSARPPAPLLPLNGHTSQRFLEWFAAFPGRKADPDGACRMWLSRVSDDDEAAAFACLSRYSASDEVARGVLTEAKNFIKQQADGKWGGQWQAKRTEAKPPNKQGSLAERTLAVMQRRISNGEPPL